MKPRLTQKRLRQLLIYVPETGRFYWRKRRGSVAAGNEAGNLGSTGYRMIGIDGHEYYAHRLAWVHVHGVDPSGDIDHRNGNPADNSIANLQDIPRGKNGHRARKRRPAGSGFRGVWRSASGKWRARIAIDGKRIYLGTFATAEEAARAYDRAARKYYGKFAMTNAELFGLDRDPGDRLRPDLGIEVRGRVIVPQDLLCIL
jgi:AP2 domain/HNH endonuclease